MKKSAVEIIAGIVVLVAILVVVFIVIGNVKPNGNKTTDKKPTTITTKKTTEKKDTTKNKTSEDTKTYNVSYELYDGTNDPSNPSTFTNKDSITLKDAHKDGFEFKGWYKEAGFINKVTKLDSSITSDITLYAKFEQIIIPYDYSIVYHLDGGENNTNNPIGFMEDETITLLDAYKDGYEFKGWFTNDAYSGAPVTVINVNTDYELYAKFEVIKYTIEYMNVDGLDNLNPTSYTQFDDDITLKSVTKQSNEFKGWFTTSTFDIDSKIEVIETSSKTNYVLYAQFEIIKTDPTVIVTPNNSTYDFEEHELVNAATSGGTIYYSLDNETFTTDIPKAKNAGTYIVYYKFIGDEYHFDLDVTSVTVKINKLTYDMSGIEFNGDSKVYTGNAQPIYITGELPYGVTVTYDNNENINVGNYTVTANFNVDLDNCEAIESKTATLNITKATYDMSGITLSGNEMTYDGEVHSLAISGTLPLGVSVSYENNNKTNVGTYEVIAIFSGDENNYEPIANKTAILKINKATYNMSNVEFNDDSVTYDGETHSLSITGTLPTGVTVTYENNGKINAGSYTVTAKFVGDATNYELIDNMTATLTINKAAYDMSSIEFNDLTVDYDGETHSIVISGTLPTGVSIEYENNGKINAGSYTITAKFSGDATNYEAIENKTAILTINKLTYDMSNVEFNGTTVTYDGETHSLAITGTLPTGVSVTYENNGKISAGTYTVIAKFSGDETNYELIENKTATLVINKAEYDMTGITFDGAEVTYDGEVHSLAISGTLPTGVSVEYENNGKINFGTYTVIAKFSGDATNYELIDNLTATLVINKATYDMSGISFDGDEVTYDGEVHSLAISGTLPTGVAVSYENNDKVNANTYTVIAKFSSANPNYNDIDDMEATLIINKATATATAPTAVEGLVYDGTQLTLINAGSVSVGSIEYKYNDLEWTTQLVKAIFPGSYLVKYRYVLNDNYNEIEGGTVVVNIDKATIDMSGISFNDGSKAYTGTELSLEITGELNSNVTVTYEGAGITCGTYEIIAKFSVNTQCYNEIDDMTATLTITPATMTNVTVAGYNAMIDGESHSIVASKTAITVDSSEVTWLFSVDGENWETEILVSDPSNSGTYYFKATAANHNEYSGSFEVVITDKNVTTIEITNLDSLNKTYDETAIVDPIINTNSNGEVSITYSTDGINFTDTKPVNAGQYTIKVETLETSTYAKGSLQKTFDIAKADYDMSGISFSDETITYDKTSHSLEISGTLPDGVIASYSGNDKVNAGTYPVTAIFTHENPNYNAISNMSATLTIEKATFDMSGVSMVDTSKVYTGSAQIIEITGTLPSGMTVDYEGSGTNVGTYTIYAVFDYDVDNYNSVYPMDATLTITKATYDMSGITFNDSTVTYDKLGHKLTISGTLPEGVTVSYSDTNSYTTVGSYEYIASFSGDYDNYNEISDMTASLTITKATIDMSEVVFADKTVTYNGNPYSITVTNLPHEIDSVTYTNNGQTEAGTYTITASFVYDTENYNVIDDMTAALTIEKATIDMSGVVFADKTVTYNGNAQSITVTDLPHEIDGVTYSNNGKINSGTYTITASFAYDTDNYNAVDDMTATLTIEKATINMSAVVFDDKTVTYDGNAQSITATNLPHEITSVNYTNNGQINAGIYTITASFVYDTDNYNAVDDMTATLTINKKVIDNSNIDLPDATFTYDGQVKSLVYTGTLPDEIVGVYYNGNNQTNAGEYDVILTFNYDMTNYTVSVLQIYGTLTIEKATINMSGVVFEDKTVTYNGSAYSITATNLPDTITGVTYTNNGQTEAGTYTITASFEYDTNNYNTVSGKTATLTINKANPTYTVPTGLKATPSDTLANVTLPSGFTFNDPLTTSVGAEGDNTFLVTFTPDDTNNFNTIDNIEVVITVRENEKYAITCANNQSTTYNSFAQEPVVSVKLGEVDVTSGYSLSFAYKLTSATSYTTGLPTNAGTYNIKINCTGSEGDAADEVIVTYIINKAQLTVTSTLIGINYDSSKRTWALMQTEIASNITSSGLIGSDSTTFTITGMHNGKYKYGTVSGTYTVPTSDPIFGSSYTNVIGSTYQVFISQSNTNYELADYNIILKYKTAMISSTYYTIEDALSASGTITFAGDSSSAQTYVATTFSSLSTSITSYQTSYTLSSRTLIVPYNNTTTDHTNNGGSSVVYGNVYTALVIPSGITLNFTSSSILTVAAEIGANGGGKSTAVKIHGVIVNNGTININSGCTVNAYGFIKGNGTLNLLSGSKIIECMCIFDWVGGTAASGIRGNAFITNSYIVNNTACIVNINSGATFEAFAMIYAGSTNNPASADLIIPSTSSSNNYLFKPTSTSGKITKKCSNPNGTNPITANNQLVSYNSIFEIEGSWVDGVVSITVYVSISTGTSLALPIGLMDIVIKSGATLNISKSDFLFLPGSSLTIEEGATINITNSSCDFTFATYNQIADLGGNRNFTKNDYSSKHVDAVFVCNGTFSCAGGFGGKITTTGENAKVVLSSKTTSSFVIMISTDSPRYKTGLSQQAKINLYENGMVNQTITYLSSTGTYYSIKDSNNNYGFYTTSGVISYNTNGGVGSYSSKSITIGASGYTIINSDLPSTNPTKSYYSFGGWYTDDTFTTLALGYTTYCGIELFAKWNLVDYSINYIDVYDNGASGNTSTSTNPSTFNYETTMALADPTNGDYVFGGWFIDSTCTNKINMINGSSLVSYLSSNSITLYALWFNEGTDRYVVTFENSNENITCASSDTIIDDGFDWSSYELPVMTQGDNNYQVSIYFGGWYNGETLVTSLSSSLFEYNSVTGNYELTLTASWIDKNQLEVTIPNVGSLMTVYYKPNFTFTIPTLESKGITLGQSGLVLINWHLDDGHDYNSGQTITLTTQSVLTANLATFVKLIIGENEYTTITVTLTSGQGYTVNYNEETGVSTAVAFTGQTITNGSSNYVTTGSKFQAKYAYSGNQSDGKATISGTTPTSNLTESNTTYTVTATTGNVTITPTGTSSCLIEGTLITMADGTVKPVEEIVAGDLLLVFNHETGEYDVSFVLFNDAEKLDNYAVIYLEFSNGKTIGVVSEHGFFDLDLNKYVYIDYSNYQDFIGHHFYSMDSEDVVLTNSYITYEEIRVYSPVTAFELNYFTEGMLSMPGGIPGLFNIFDYDSNLKYDSEKMQEDIDTYGLFTYADFEEYIPEEIYEVFNGKYLKIAIAKGLLTFEDILYYVERYSIYW